MKISELINELKERQVMFGDVDIEIRNRAGVYDVPTTFNPIFGPGEIGYKKAIKLELDT